MAKIISSLLIMLIFGSLMIVPAQASVVDDISGSLTNFEKAATGTTTEQEPTKALTIAGLIINIILSVLGIVFIAYLLYGGFLWMTAAGNQEELDKAKRIITNSIIAVIVIMSTYAIAQFVMTQVQQATF